MSNDISDKIELPDRVMNTGEGEKLVAFKKMGENEVPLGCFYDEGDRYEALIKLLDVSIFPLVIRVEASILEEFHLNPSQLQCSIFGWNKDLQADSIELGVFQIKEILRQFGENNFRFFVNFDCTMEVDGSIQEWGTQLSILYGDEHWLDEDEADEYPVWFIYFNDEKTVLETPFTIEQEEAIITDVTTKMQDYYQETYGK